MDGMAKMGEEATKVAKIGKEEAILRSITPITKRSINKMQAHMGTTLSPMRGSRNMLISRKEQVLCTRSSSPNPS